MNNMDSLRQKLPKYKVGDMIKYEIRMYIPNLTSCPHCQFRQYGILYDGTIYCMGCFLVLGKMNNDKKEPKEEKKKVKHCEKHKQFIPSCKDCNEIKNSTEEITID